MVCLVKWIRQFPPLGASLSLQVVFLDITGTVRGYEGGPTLTLVSWLFLQWEIKNVSKRMI